MLTLLEVGKPNWNGGAAGLSAKGAADIRAAQPMPQPNANLLYGRDDRRFSQPEILIYIALALRQENRL